ncbi:PDZ domain-containing protein [Aureibaculum algae]|uniref:PDZ domain-containing protein n=1 Tax=Aureibaculum algae TaxID=2584122 RepID=A0A5B7U2B8_9FLAO|nr:PDZ domain-containing protein [Aureibaculum algae]
MFRLSILMLMFIGCKPIVSDLYVSKNNDSSDFNDGKIVLSTLEEAINKVNRLRNNGKLHPITIHLEAGEHRITSPIRIGNEQGSLKLIGAGNDKTIIKGSKKLNLSWQKHNSTIWIAKVEKNEIFDALYINGKPQIMARYPNYEENGGHWQGHAADALSKERISSWSNPIGAFLHVMHSGEWGDFHYKITEIDENGEAKLIGGHQNNRPSKMHEKYRMVENVFEELDSPGEWYLDTHDNLYYWPMENIDLANALVEASEQKHLIEIVGTEEKPVSNVEISNLKFEHTQRTFMEKYEPLLRSDWTIYRGGAIFIEGAQDIKIENCEFTNLGGNAIFVSNFNRNIEISNNHIHKIGASAICLVGSPEAVRSPSFQYNEFMPLPKMDTIKGPKNNKYPSNVLVDNNLIYKIGRIEKQTAGVEIAMAMNITVSNNSIYDVPRAGINIGDGTWGGHIIEYNDVFNTVLESGDHGAFNSWGRDRFWHPNRETMDGIVEANPQMPTWDATQTTIIRNNRFRCDHGWDIDLDDGSSNYQIYNNLCLNGGIKLREGFNRTVENNITINNGFHPHVWFKNSNDIFKSNIVFTEHRDIRLQEWGKEVDFNFFPDQKTLLASQNKGVDKHSIFGDPLFEDAKSGNYKLKNNSRAFEIGFKNFDMTGFGVKNKKLKALAKTPNTPIIFFSGVSEKSSVYEWLGAKIKNITTIEERSAAGLNKTAGVLITSIDENSIIGNSELKVGDVIISCQGLEINEFANLMKSFQNDSWLGKLDLLVFRNQKDLKIELALKK